MLSRYSTNEFFIDSKKRYATPDFGVFDIETNTDGVVLDIGIYYRKRYKVFGCVKDFLKYVARKKIRFLYAHNAGHFDTIVLFDPRYANQYSNIVSNVEYTFSGSSVIFAKISFHDSIKPKVSSNESKFIEKYGDCQIIDSAAIIPLSLQKASQALLGEKHSKKRLSQDCYDDMEKFKSENPDAYYEYLKRDVMTLYDSINKFFELVNDNVLGGRGSKTRLAPGRTKTIGSASVKIFRSMMPKGGGIYTPVQNSKIDVFSREAYVGGRCELFLPEKYQREELRGIKVYDYNSLYPSVMRDADFPVSFKTIKLSNLDKVMEYKCGICKIEYDQSDLLKKTNGVGILADPVCRQFSNKTGAGWFDISEVRYAIENGVKIKLDHAFVFPMTAKIFTEFVDKLFDIRRHAKMDGNDGLALIAKLLMNSISGKFAQRGEISNLVYIDNQDEMLELLCRAKEKVLSVKVLDTPGWFEVKKKIVYSKHVFTYISAHINALGRIKLFDAMRAVDFNVVYCDTDSIHTFDALPDHLVDDIELGKMKLERIADRAFYVREKVYAMTVNGRSYSPECECEAANDSYIVAKNVDRRAVAEFSYDDFVKMANDKKLEFVVTHVDTARESLSKNGKPGKFQEKKVVIHNY